MMPDRRPFPLVLAAPSGSGKTSLARALVDRREDVVFSLSATTRPPRPGERHDEDYRFVDDAGFDRLVESGELLEWAYVHGRRYGTLRSGVEEALARDRTVVLDIDVQGARRLRETLPSAVHVFILPPSVDEMLRRLRERGSESDAEVATRLRTARAELDAVVAFDHVIVNDDFEQAVRDIEAVLEAGRTGADLDPDVGSLIERLRADIDRTLERSS
jgi:guanylate kinase